MARIRIHPKYLHVKCNLRWKIWVFRNPTKIGSDLDLLTKISRIPWGFHWRQVWYCFFTRNRKFLLFYIQHNISLTQYCAILGCGSVSLYWDPDPSFHFSADLDLTFYLNADPDPAPWCDCESATTGLHAYIVIVHGPPWLRFEPLQLLNFNFITDLDLMRIRIYFLKIMLIRIRNRDLFGIGVVALSFASLPYYVDWIFFFSVFLCTVLFSILYCYILRPSDSPVSEDSWVEFGIVAKPPGYSYIHVIKLQLGYISFTRRLRLSSRNNATYHLPCLILAELHLFEFLDF